MCLLLNRKKKALYLEFEYHGHSHINVHIADLKYLYIDPLRSVSKKYLLLTFINVCFQQFLHYFFFYQNHSSLLGSRGLIFLARESLVTMAMFVKLTPESRGIGTSVAESSPTTRGRTCHRSFLPDSRDNKRLLLQRLWQNN